MTGVAPGNLPAMVPTTPEPVVSGAAFVTSTVFMSAVSGVGHSA